MKTLTTGAVVGPTSTVTSTANPNEGGVGGGGGGGSEKKNINAELWQACAGQLVNLPAAGTHVVYFPQGHSEQVAASMKKDIDAQIPNYPHLPSKLLCLLHNVTLHADPETDEVYAQMTLQPVPTFDKEALLRSDLSLKSNKPPPEFFCKTLTASDTSTHGGFSVPRRAAEKIFPSLDFSMQPPAQELVARDLHDNVWTFRHIYRGQPKRHLLTTGWSLFVGGKRLFAGDAVLFIRDEKQQLLLGIRRANRQSNNLSSSVLSSDSMHIGILAAAAHAAANNSPFTVFYNPRASPSEFVIPLAKYYKAVYSNQISLGMRFRMMFETEEAGTRRYMGTITGISDLDPVRWKNSQWRNLQVGWDESTAGEKRNRVSVWEIEPVTAPFFICPPPFFRSKRPRQPGMPDDDSSDLDGILRRTMPWLGDDMGMRDPQGLPGLSLVQWMNMQQNPSLVNSLQPNYMQSLPNTMLQNLAGTDLSCQLGMSAPQISQANNVPFNAQRLPQQTQQISQANNVPFNAQRLLQQTQQISQANNVPFNAQRLPQQTQQIAQLPELSSAVNPLGPIIQPQQQLGDISHQSRQSPRSQTLTSTQVQAQMIQPQTLVQNSSVLQQQQPMIQSYQNLRNLPSNLHQHQSIMGQNGQQGLVQPHLTDQLNQQIQISDNQIQLQQLQRLQQQQQSLSTKSTTMNQPGQMGQHQDPQKQLLDASQSMTRTITPNQVVEMPQTMSNSLAQSSITQHQMTNDCSQASARFSNPPQYLKRQKPGMISEMPRHMGLPPPSTPNQLSTYCGSLLNSAAGAGQSVVTDDVPSCSTSPSTNNCSNGAQPMLNGQVHLNKPIGEDIALSAATLLSPSALETMQSNTNFQKDLQQKPDVKPSVNISKSQNLSFFSPPYLNGTANQTDYLDTSSSTTSVCFSQNDLHMPQNNNSMLLRDTSQEGDLQADPRNNVPYGISVDGQPRLPINSDNMLTKGMASLEKDFPNHISSGGIVSNCDNSRDPQQELSSSMVTQSFGVPDMAFNSIDSTINDSSFVNRGPWAPAPQFQRMRTYTKVYKRGAVGRSIDITRYSGYDELKQDLARRFGIEGQLEDRHRIGWKLVYVDHENDVLLVGDDPWEEFVNCVRCIKILSPQEVQQMSLDGDFGNSVLPNQACSSSDNGMP